MDEKSKLKNDWKMTDEEMGNTNVPVIINKSYDELHQQLTDAIRKNNLDVDMDKISEAFTLAYESHIGQKRKSGEDYILHPVEVAEILVDMRMDTDTIVAGLLHDVVEDTLISLSDIEYNFGTDVKKLVDGVTKLRNLPRTNSKKLEKSIAILENNKTRNLIVENFKQFVYKDPKTGTSVKYNLYIPKNYDKNKKYPLVLFMHDMGVLSEDTKTTLLQGNGAISFATPEEQARHEAFVLAPQYSRQVVDDNGDITSDLDATVNLIRDYLISKYSIDEKKLYATGQSMGGMMAIVMNYKYPELFAASYLVACQWNPKEVSTMAKNNLWITVSTGDEKAYPGMNAITSELIKRGATVAKDNWRADYTDAQFLEGARKVIAQKSNIKYTTLEKGTNPYLPKDANPGLEHSGTWKVAYNIPGIKDWMFLQSKQWKALRNFK